MKTLVFNDTAQFGDLDLGKLVLSWDLIFEIWDLREVFGILRA